MTELFYFCVHPVEDPVADFVGELLVRVSGRKECDLYIRVGYDYCYECVRIKRLGVE